MLKTTEYARKSFQVSVGELEALHSAIKQQGAVQNRLGEQTREMMERHKACERMV